MPGIESGKTWIRIGAVVEPTSSAASGIFTPNEVARYTAAETWPLPLGPSQLIQSTYLTSNTSAVTLSNIPQTFDWLVLRGNFLPAVAGQLDVSLNGGASSLGPETYYYRYGATSTEYIQYSKYSISSSTTLASINATYQEPVSKTTDYDVVPFELVLPNYAGTTYQKNGIWNLSMVSYNQYNSTNVINQTGVVRFNDTAAITSITLTAGTNWFSNAYEVTGVSLWGWGS